MTENHISGNALKLTLKCNFGFVNCARACVHVCVRACARTFVFVHVSCAIK